MADLLSKLRDVDTPESRIAQSVATGAFTALVSPRKLSSRSLLTMHVFSGLLGGAGGAMFLGGQARPPARAAVAVVAGATLFGASALGTVADTKAEEWLLRKGVRRPRLWMGLVAAVVTWLTSGPKPPREPEEAPDGHQAADASRLDSPNDRGPVVAPHADGADPSR